MTTDANQQLQAIIPNLREFEKMLRKISENFEEIKYYEKFRFHRNKPSFIPVLAIQDLAKEIFKIKDELLNFKKSFNENDLEESLRNPFLEIFIQINKKDDLIKNGYIMLGNGVDLWHKSPEEVIRDWDKQDYPFNYRYSQQCYSFVKGYLPLADLINQLGEGLYS